MKQHLTKPVDHAMKSMSSELRDSRDLDPRALPVPRAETKRRVLLGIAFVGLCTTVFSGCAALTNPTANGVPVRILPEELLAETREDFELLPLTYLRQPPPEVYLLEPGDTLGVYIEGILGSEEIPPPVNVPDTAEQPPSIGYPFPIRQDGTISLPYVGAIAVAKPALEESITIEQAEERVVEAYREKEILRVEDKRILVSLLRPRYVRVMVLRDDTSRPAISISSSSLLGLGSSSATIGGGKNNIGQILELPAYQNDVLNALARTGGVPDVESTEEILVQRGFWDVQSDPNALACNCPTQADLIVPDGRRSVTHIPLRTKCNETLPFGPKEVILENGDIIVVKNRDLEFYYTGGLISSSEHVLPLDYDLTVVEAVLRARGPLLNGGFNTSNLNGSVIGSGTGNPSPSLLSVLRKTPQGGQVTIRIDLNEAMRDPRENILVQADDILLLQEMPNEAFTRYFTQAFQVNLFGRFANRRDFQGSTSAVLP